MAYTENLYGLDASAKARVTRYSEETLAISYPTDTYLPEGTPVKFTSGKLVAATNSRAIGIVKVSLAPSENQAIRKGYATVLVYGLAEVTGKAGATIVAGDELKFTGVESGTNKLLFAPAVSTDTVVAFAGKAAANAADVEGVVMLCQSYIKE